MATLLRTWDTNWFVNGGATWSGWLDGKGRIKVYYEQFPAQNMTKVTIKHYIVGKLSDNYYHVYAENVTSSYGARNGAWPTSYSTATISNKDLGISNSKEKEGLIGTTTHNVYHNADGTCHLYVSGSINGSVYEGQDGYTVAGNKPSGFDVYLPQISRATTITNDTSSASYKDFGTLVTFNLSTPGGNTNTLTYNVAGTTYTIGTGIITSATHTFPTSLIPNYPNNEYVTILVTCTSSNGVVSNTTVYLKVPSSYVPSASRTISDVGDVPSAWGVWVKTKSKINGVITASGESGSTIVTYYSNVNNENFYTSSFTTSYLKYSGTLAVHSTIVDSRNRPVYINENINVIDYFTPTISSFSVVRCLQNGTEDNEGTYGKVKCTYSIAPINNGTTDLNSKSLVVKYGDVTKTFALSTYSGTYEATDLFSGLSTASNHAFEFYIIDYFNPNGILYNFTMTPSFTTLSYLNGGRGVSIGQVATEEGFNSYMDSYFHEKIEGLYQVGDIFLSFSDRNPSLKFGGTWELVAQGRTLVGVDTSQAEFNTVKKQGGSKELQAHSHVVKTGQRTNAWEAPNLVLSYQYQSAEAYEDNSTIENAGTGQSGNLQPYITCYIWEKIE